MEEDKKKKKIEKTEESHLSEYRVSVSQNKKKEFRIVLVTPKWVIFDVGNGLSHVENIWKDKFKPGDMIAL